MPIITLATALLVSIVPTSASALDVWLKAREAADAPNDQKVTLYQKSKALVIGIDHDAPGPKADADFRDKAISLRRFGEYTQAKFCVDSRHGTELVFRQLSVYDGRKQWRQHLTAGGNGRTTINAGQPVRWSSDGFVVARGASVVGIRRMRAEAEGGVQGVREVSGDGGGAIGVILDGIAERREGASRH